MDREIKYNLWINGFNVNWIRTRLEKRKGNVQKNKFFRQIRNEHNRCLKRLGWFENNEND
jgi:hypothetical protein